MPKKYTVKYYEGTLPRWKGYEEFNTALGLQRVVFEKTDKGVFANDVPEELAVRLHRSDAYDIVDEKGVVSAEFAAGASPHGKPKPPASSAPAQPSAKELELAAENERLKAQLLAAQRTGESEKVRPAADDDAKSKTSKPSAK